MSILRVSVPANIPSGLQVQDVVLQSAGISPGTALGWLFLPGGSHLVWRRNHISLGHSLCTRDECEPSTGTTPGPAASAQMSDQKEPFKTSGDVPQRSLCNQGREWGQHIRWIPIPALN